MNSECKMRSDALRSLESEPSPVKIAFAYGPMRVSHQAFLAPFLGGKLNNELVYVSPEKDGAILPHHPFHFDKARPDPMQLIRIGSPGSS